MAQASNYLPEDLQGLPSFPSNGSRFYYKEAEDGTYQLVAQVFAKSHFIIYFPAGTTVVPDNSVGSEQIKDGAVELADLNDEVKEKMTNTYDSENKKLTLGGIAG